MPKLQKSIMKSTKVVLFTTNGIAGNMVCAFLQENYTLSGMVLQSPIPGAAKRMVKRRVKNLGLFKVFSQLLFQKGLVPFLKMESKSRLKELTVDINKDIIDNHKNHLKPRSINDDSVVRYTNELKPDLIMVCGTGIIKKNIIESLNAPLINIHVGITPKYRGVHGGYWALANDEMPAFEPMIRPGPSSTATWMPP